MKKARMIVMKHGKQICLLGLVVVILLMPSLVHAQDNLPGDPDAPIDGGLSLLAAAGIGYGTKKLREKRKKHSNDAI